MKAAKIYLLALAENLKFSSFRASNSAENKCTFSRLASTESNCFKVRGTATKILV